MSARGFSTLNYRFVGGKIVARSKQVFDNAHEAAYLNHRKREKNRMPRIAKKTETLEENFLNQKEIY